jgi:hypothetical protein
MFRFDIAARSLKRIRIRAFRPHVVIFHLISFPSPLTSRGSARTTERGYPQRPSKVPLDAAGKRLGQQVTAGNFFIPIRSRDELQRRRRIRIEFRRYQRHYAGL